MMTFKEIYEAVIKELDEKQEEIVLQRIKSYINRGYRELAKKERLERVINRSVENVFTKPDDLIRIIQILDSNNRPLDYSYEGGRIRLNYEGSVSIIYNYVPENLVFDEDLPETNPANIDYIINYAKWLYNLVEEQDEVAKIYKVEYEAMNIVKNNYKMTKTIDIYGNGGED